MLFKIVLYLFGWKWVDHIENAWDDCDLYKKGNLKLYVDRE